MSSTSSPSRSRRRWPPSASAAQGLRVRQHVRLVGHAAVVVQRAAVTTTACSWSLIAHSRRRPWTPPPTTAEAAEGARGVASNMVIRASPSRTPCPAPGPRALCGPQGHRGAGHHRVEVERPRVPRTDAHAGRGGTTTVHACCGAGFLAAAERGHAAPRGVVGGQSAVCAAARTTPSCQASSSGCREPAAWPSAASVASWWPRAWRPWCWARPSHR